jgi:hypothetical protein
MQSKTVYVADDGTEFNTELEAIAHDRLCEVALEIDAYCATLPDGPQRTRARNTIMAYATYRASKPNVTRASFGAIADTQDTAAA